MASKVYRVVAIIGRKRNIVFESKPFDESDGEADMQAFRDARKAKEKYRMSLLADGYYVTNSGNFYHPQRKIDGGRFEVVRCTKPGREAAPENERKKFYRECFVITK